MLAAMKPVSLSDLLHWEDFPVGHQIDTAGMAVDRDAIVAFAHQFDPQPFHTDEEAAKQSLFGGLCASGWHTCAIDRKSTRLNSSHLDLSRMPSSA